MELKIYYFFFNSHEQYTVAMELKKINLAPLLEHDFDI